MLRHALSSLVVVGLFLSSATAGPCVEGTHTISLRATGDQPRVTTPGDVIPDPLDRFVVVCRATDTSALFYSTGALDQPVTLDRGYRCKRKELPDGRVRFVYRARSAKGSRVKVRVKAVFEGFETDHVPLVPGVAALGAPLRRLRVKARAKDGGLFHPIQTGAFRWTEADAPWSTNIFQSAARYYEHVDDFFGR